MAVVALVFPAAASAGRLDLDGSDLTYRAAAGERNRVTVTGVVGSVTVTDRAGVRAGRGCRSIRRGAAVCALTEFPGEVSLTRIALGDRDDRVDVESGSNDAELFGGRGADRLTSKAERRTVFVGGPGRDTMIGSSDWDLFDEGARPNGSDSMLVRGLRRPVTYTTRAYVPTGPWVDYSGRTTSVRASLDGKRNDGARGERDLIGRGVVGLRGGRRADRLVGNDAANALAGEGGSDVLVGKGGTDELAATHVGWPRVSPIEGASHEPTSDRLAGGAGADLLEGSDGANRIDPGPGPDEIWALAGDDDISARDGDVDQVGCGAGDDRVANDPSDLRIDCETAVAYPPGAVPIGAYTLIRDSHPIPDPHPFVVVTGVGCAVRVPCDGSVELRLDGQLLGTASFSIDPRTAETPSWAYRTFVEIPVAQDVLSLVDKRDPRISLVGVTAATGVRREASLDHLAPESQLTVPFPPTAYPY
jgi:hypothetical protein